MVVAAALAVVLGTLGLVWASSRGGKPATPRGELVAAERGNVSVTVGGIGHVTTLTGAARLSVPASSSSSGAAAGSSSAGAASGSSASAGGGSSQAPADAVFPALAGHVTGVLIHTGERVIAGQPIAKISDDGTTAGTILQADADLATAKLELAQKSVQDPARGLPPTPAELAAGRQGIQAARLKLQRLTGPPLPVDVAAARQDLAKAVADLQSARDGTPEAVAAAELAVETAQQKLQTLTGSPDPADVAVAQLELARATLDQETLLMSAQPPADPNAPAPAPPTAAAQAAAQLAVDAARKKLDAVLHPPIAVVTAARAELAKAQADLAAIRASHSQAGLAAAQAGVTTAQRKLDQVLAPQAPEVVSAARLDLLKAQADLAIMRQRGGPASATDLALARLKVDVASQRAGLARQLEDRLTVRASSSGTVTSLLTTKGAAVDAATPVARVQDLDHLVVTLDLSEFDVSRTRTGALAHITVDALGGREFGGHVLDVALSGNENGGVVNFPVTIALGPKSHGRLRPGMSVRARIVVMSRDRVVRIPLAAVSDRGNHPSVLVRGRSGAFTKRSVKLGLAGTEVVEVLSGLRTGERVLIPSGP